MAQIGALTIERTDDGWIGKGSIRTRSIQERFVVEPINRDEDRKKPPTHGIFAAGFDGSRIQIGEAWQYTQNAGDNQGAIMFGLRFTDPDFPSWAESLPAFATSPDNSGPLAIMFDRSRNQSKATEGGDA